MIPELMDLTHIRAILHPKDWFEEYCYMDQDSDWFLTEEIYELYSHYDGNGSNPYAIYIGDEHVVKGYIDYYESDTLRYGWAVDKLVTKENHPEYWL